MGRVFRARQLSLNRTVAIKTLLPGTAEDPEKLARFRVEAEAAGALSHPNIVAIYEVGEIDGQPFLAMAYVDGETLEKHLVQGPWEIPDAAALVKTLAEAVHHAHQRGVLHRDLKPGNILLDREGKPKITDFGIAKILKEKSTSLTTQVAGTPSYMAPEQTTGKGVSVATDVYALGAILYRVITGHPPQLGESPEQVLYAVYYLDPKRPREYRTEIPLDLETIALKCLAKEPDRRYPDAQALAEDLRRFLAREPILAREVSAWERLWLRARRHPTLSILSALLAISVIAGIVLQSMSLARVRVARLESERLITFLDEQLATDLRQLGRLDLMGKVITNVTDYYRRYPTPPDSESKTRRAEFYHLAAVAEHEMGKLPEALAHGREALHQRQLATNPRLPANSIDLARENLLLAELESVNDNDANAARYLSSARAEYEPVLSRTNLDMSTESRLSEVLLTDCEFGLKHGKPEDSKERLGKALELLRHLGSSPTPRPEIQSLVAESDFADGVLSKVDGDANHALESFQRYVAQMSNLVQTFPKEASFRYALAVAYQRVGDELRGYGALSESEPFFRAFHEQSERLAQQDPLNSQWQTAYASSLWWMSEIEAQTSPELANKHLSAAEQVYEKLLGLFPDRLEWRSSLIDIELGLANSTLQAGILADEERHLKKAVTNAFDAAFRAQSRLHPFEKLTLVVTRMGERIGRDSGNMARIEYLQSWVENLGKERQRSRQNAWWTYPMAHLSKDIALGLHSENKFSEAAENAERGISFAQAALDLDPRNENLLLFIPHLFADCAVLNAKAQRLDHALSMAESAMDWSQPKLKTRDTSNTMLQMISRLLKYSDGASPPLKSRTLALAKDCLSRGFGDYSTDPNLIESVKTAIAGLGSVDIQK
jgi:tetratricopeptide (TPR) repeat protein